MTRSSAIGVDRRGRLREIRGVRQDTDAPLRRWFTCATADLYLWQDEQGIAAFEFCWGKPSDERLLRWSRDGTTLHARVDDGEDDPASNRSPVLDGAVTYDAEAASLAFELVGADVETCVYRLLLGALHRGDPSRGID